MEYKPEVASDNENIILIHIYIYTYENFIYTLFSKRITKGFHKQLSKSIKEIAFFTHPKKSIINFPIAKKWMPTSNDRGK